MAFGSMIIFKNMVVNKAYTSMHIIFEGKLLIRFWYQN